MVLRCTARARSTRASAPELYAHRRELARRAGLPMPRVYLMDNPQPNAFATGRNPEHAAVAVTTGLLQTLSREELAGVMAHELAHIKNHDTLTMTITATIAGAISMLAQFRLLLRRQRATTTAMSASIGTLALLILGAARRHAGADGDQPHARIRGRPGRRRDQPAAAVRSPPRLRKIASAAHAYPEHDGRAQSGYGASCSSSTRCPARAWTICSRPIPRPRTASRARGDGARHGRDGDRARQAQAAPASGPWARAAAAAAGRGPWG